MPDEKPVPETLETIGEKLTALSASVETVDHRLTALSVSVDHRLAALSASVDHRLTALSASVETVDHRLTALSASVDHRLTALSASVDRRFDEVSEAFVEQRKYTEFAVEQLRVEIITEMNSGFGRVDRKLDRVLDTLTRTPPRRRQRS